MTTTVDASHFISCISESASQDVNEQCKVHAIKTKRESLRQPSSGQYVLCQMMQATSKRSKSERTTEGAAIDSGTCGCHAVRISLSSTWNCLLRAALSSGVGERTPRTSLNVGTAFPKISQLTLKTNT